MCGVRELGPAVVRFILTYSADFHTRHSQLASLEPLGTIKKNDEQVWASSDEGGTQQIIIMKGVTSIGDRGCG